MKGKFIVFEGIEGCGKTTQKNLVNSYLTEKGYNIFEVREPGGTRISEHIRDILLNPAYTEMSSRAELFLYEAARAQLVSEVLQPNLLVNLNSSKGTIGIMDRCYHATIAYQGFGRGLDISLIIKASRYAMDDLIPNLTIIYDVPVEVGLERKGKDLDRMEQEDTSFHERVRKGYLELPKLLFDEEIFVIDSNRKVEEVFEDTKECIDEILI